MRFVASLVLVAAALPSGAIAAKSGMVAAPPPRPPAPHVRPVRWHNSFTCPGAEAPVIDSNTGQTICPSSQFGRGAENGGSSKRGH
jgi:hypothetical protein